MSAFRYAMSWIAMFAMIFHLGATCAWSEQQTGNSKVDESAFLDCLRGTRARYVPGDQLQQYVAQCMSSRRLKSREEREEEWKRELERTRPGDGWRPF
jgi:hypothetical protein